MPHLGICRDVLELVVIHDFHLAVFQGVGDCKRNARFGGDDGGSTLFDLGEHFLFDRDGLGPSAFGASTGDAGVGLGPVGLKSCSDVLAHIDIGNVDRDDLESGLVIEPAGEHGFGNHVGVFKHGLMAFGRSDRRDDSLADPRDDCVFGGTTDELG